MVRFLGHAGECGLFLDAEHQPEHFKANVVKCVCVTYTKCVTFWSNVYILGKFTLVLM